MDPRPETRNSLKWFNRFKTKSLFSNQVSKTVASQTTSYLYDGVDIVQELSSGTPSADMLNGLGVDERLTCSCNGAPRTLLTDALGSAVALTDLSGSVQTEYTYDPFGAVNISGTSSSNAAQFTGRENDSTGLYYYRARYYSPVLQRFISEDPLGFGGGDANFYAYVGNSPTNFTDPSGTTPLGAICLAGAISGVALDIGLSLLAGRKVTLSGVAASAVAGCIGALVGFGLGRLGLRALRGLRNAKAAKSATYWGNPKTLADHFARHGADFGAKTADDYARMASDFFRRSQANRLPTKITPNGTIRVYDPKHNILGSYNPSGTTKTFYKPDPAQHGLPSNLDYWNKQPGVAPWQL